MEKLHNLKELELHDCDVSIIEISFETKSLTLVIDLAEDTKKRIVFKEVKDMCFDGNYNFDELEIYSASFEEQIDEFIADFTFLLGFGKPSLNLRFKFLNFHIYNSPIT
jgi:hypothetical protein